MNFNFIFSSFDVPAGCLNTQESGVVSDRALRVVELDGREIVVTVSNMDGDGYLAIPDAYAGGYFWLRALTLSSY